MYVCAVMQKIEFVDTPPKMSPNMSPKMSPKMSQKMSPKISPKMSPKLSAKSSEMSPKLIQKMSPKITMKMLPKVSPKLSAKMSSKISPQLSPKMSPKIFPNMSPKLLPKLSPKMSPKISPKMTPNTSPQILPKMSPKISSKMSPKMIPKVSPQLSPKLSPKMSPKISPKMTPNICISPQMSPKLVPKMPTITSTATNTSPNIMKTITKTRTVDDPSHSSPMPPIREEVERSVGVKSLSRSMSLNTPGTKRPSGLTQPLLFPTPPVQTDSITKTPKTPSLSEPITFSLVSKQRLQEFRRNMYRHHTFNCGLKVRRGSEPVLADITLLPKKLNTPVAVNHSNKLSVANDNNDEVEIFPWQPSKQLLETTQSLPGEPPPPLLPLRLCGSGREKSSSPEGGHASTNGRFSRDAARRSLANNGNLFRWLEAQQNQQEAFERQSRKEPLGGSGRVEDDDTTVSVVSTEPGSSIASRDSVLVCLKNTKEPLGIHVVPDYDRHGRDMGLVIQGIEEGRRIDKDGRLHTQDRIVEINNTSLLDLDFNKAQDVFKAALQSDEIQLRIIPTSHAPTPAIPPPLPSKPPPPSTSPPVFQNDASPELAPSSAGPSKRMPPAIPARHPSTTLSEPASPEIGVEIGSPAKKALIIAPTNTRRIGRQININLLKGSPGLGFSVTTRDNPAGGFCPIYIKNILPGGAAISDGRLRIGDRLLKVNDVDLSDKSQKDAVALLKKAKMDSYVNLVVSRQVTEEDEKSSPSKSGSDVSQCSSPGGVTPTNPTSSESQQQQQREIIHVDIPLSDSGSATLGISVKSKTRDGPHGPEDLGVFIKSVLAGGAAARDGRLRPNDRLLCVNGRSLQHLDNECAMRDLRDSMLTNSSVDDDQSMKITVSRRVTTAPAANVPTARCREVKVSLSDFPEEEIPDGVDFARASDRRLMKLRKGGLFDSSPAGLRNTSYQQANHDSVFETPIRQKVSRSPDRADRTGDDETKHSSSDKAPRPSSTIGFAVNPPSTSAREGVTAPRLSSSRSSEALNRTTGGGAPSPPQWLTEWERAQEEGGAETDEDLADGQNPFKREGFGRQSMSEKRKKADLDPRLVEFYAKVKEVKKSKGDASAFYSATWHPRRRPRSVNEDSRDTKVISPMALRRAGSAESLVSNSNNHLMALQDKPSDEPVGPTLGLRKSSSLESLQSVIQEASACDDNDGNATGTGLWRHPNRGIVRGRGCNESFRAAVDRSYDDDGEDGEDGDEGAGGRIMESVEEESSDVGSTGGQGHSQRSSFNSTDAPAPSEDAGGRKQKKVMKEKEKGKLLKGLGSMFRFGRHRKLLEDRAPKQSAVDMRNLRIPDSQGREPGREPSREPEQREVAGRNLKAEKTKKSENVKNTSDKAQKKSRDLPATTADNNRMERIQQLRAEHQRRHLERHRQYPHDDGDGEEREVGGRGEMRNEAYERQIAEWEKKLRQQYGEYAVPPRRRPPENYERWRSSSAMSAPSDGHYGHYQNLDQIQESLRLHDYYRQQYHNYITQQQQWHRRMPYPPMRDHHPHPHSAEWLAPELTAYRTTPVSAPLAAAPHQYPGMPLGGHPAAARFVSIPPQMHYQQRPTPAPSAAFVYDRHGPHYASLPRQYEASSTARDGSRHITTTTTSAQV